MPKAYDELVKQLVEMNKKLLKPRAVYLGVKTEVELKAIISIHAIVNPGTKTIMGIPYYIVFDELHLQVVTW